MALLKKISEVLGSIGKKPSVDREDIIRLFDAARIEMFIPPLEYEVKIAGSRPRVKMKARKAEITVPERLVFEHDPGGVLLWYFRHILAHAHYCPYNIRTAYSLQKSAYEEVRDWSIAYQAVEVFSDLQVDLVYLPFKFMQAPLHLLDMYSTKPRGIDELKYSACRLVYGDFLPEYRVDRDINYYGRMLARSVLSYKPWATKVRLVASILKKLIELNKIERPKDGNKRRGEGSFIPLFEDAEDPRLRDFRQILGSIESREDAKHFYEQWLKARIDEEKLRKEVEKILEEAREEAEGKVDITAPRASGEGAGEEPHIPTSLSKPLKKIGKRLAESLWRSMWYRARAENIIVNFLGDVTSERMTWNVYSYSDLWLVEDDIEELDLEASLEEGPVIVEETTLKPVYRPSPTGDVMRKSYSPSTLIVLDSSMSMLGSFDDAATAAFIAYLSTVRLGGRSAVINFSTNYISVGWDSPGRRKELALSIPQGQLTLLPLRAIKSMLGRLRGGEQAFIVVITDCGWQNISEALPFLEKISSRGHKVLVLHIEGWKYPRNVDRIQHNKKLIFYRLRDPRSLHGVVFSEIKRAY